MGVFRTRGGYYSYWTAFEAASSSLVSDNSDEPEDKDVLVSEGEELEEVDESAFGRLMASAVEQSRCVLCVVSQSEVPATTGGSWYLTTESPVRMYASFVFPLFKFLSFPSFSFSFLHLFSLGGAAWLCRIGIEIDHVDNTLHTRTPLLKPL